jgi:hypothetical protein
MKSSNKVVIPTEFNGNSVTEIDVALFGRDDVKEVVINSKNVKLINRKNTKKINNNLVVKVGKEQYDVFKNNLLKMFVKF